MGLDDQLRAIFASTDAAGVRAYTAPDVERAVELVLVQAVRASKAKELSPGALQMLGRIALESGVVASDAPDVVRQKIDASFVARPPQQRLLSAIDGVVRALLQSGGDLGRAFGAFVADGGRVGVLGGGERPAGTVPGGLAAQLAARTPVKTKK